MNDAAAAALIASIESDEHEPARIMCRELDFGRGVECGIVFAGKHFPMVSLSVYSACARHGKREMDEYRLKGMVWKKFWRYLGAA